MFNLNDKLVYPGHGVALIEDVTEKSISGVNIKFFRLKFLYKDMTILVPISNIQNLGMRFLSDKKDIAQAIKDLYNFQNKKLRLLDFTPSGWNKRHKEYQLKIQQGKLADLMDIYKDLMCVAQQKDLSFGEKNLLQTVEELILEEIQVVTGVAREIILCDMQTPFKQFFMQGAGQVQNISSTIA